MSDDASKFDPRFDPAFQRGYDGQPQVRPAAVPSAGQPVQRTPLIEVPPAIRSETRREPAPEATPVAAAPSRLLVEPTVDYAEEPERRVNPFLIGLLAAAVLLIGGGLYLTSRLGEMFANTQGSASYDYITLQVMTFAAPMLIVLGVATGIGVLFIYAVRWGRS